MVLVELMASMVELNMPSLVKLMVELMVRKWHEQEISLSGPHSRST